jgi:branched-chain amino acid transport system substrate-binding protein
MSIIQRCNNMRSLPRIVGISLFTLCASATAFADTPRTMKIGVLNDASGPYSDNAGEGSVTAAKMAEDFMRKHPDFKVEIISADHHRRGIDAALATFPERQTRGC